MKLVKIISTNQYKIINDSDYNPDIHIDRTDNLYYLDANSDLADYITIRNMVIKAVNNKGGFSNLKNDEKEIALKYAKSVDINDSVAYYMGQGMTQDEATYTYITKSSLDIRKTANCFKDRAKSAEFMATVIMYLGMENAEIFMDNARNFLYDLTESAIIGTEYGNTRNGFMDYLHDTGDYVGSGASTFFDLPNEQDKYDMFKNTLTNIILGEWQ